MIKSVANAILKLAVGVAIFGAAALVGGFLWVTGATLLTGELMGPPRAIWAGLFALFSALALGGIAEGLNFLGKAKISR